MKKEVNRFIMNTAAYRDYDHAEEIDVIALAALKERILLTRKNHGVDGILSNAYSWDFLPQKVQKKAVDRLFHSIGMAWGFGQEKNIKLAAAQALVKVSPFVKTTVKDMYEDRKNDGLFFVHGLSPYLTEA